MLKDKIKSPGELKEILLRLQAGGKKVVFTNGCFDILHYGHVKYLEDAKKKGDVLVVAVNSDSSVKKIKGDNRPVTRERYRLATIASLASVDYVLLFKEETPLKIIKLLKPDILIKGADWEKKKIVGRDFVSSYGGKVTTLKLIKGCSTTGLIKKIAKTLSR